MPEDKKHTFEERFEMLMQSFEKSSIEAEKRQAEADKRNAEWEKRNAEFDKRMEALQQEIGGISKSNGTMAEEAIYNALEKKMIFCGVEFYDIDRNWNRKNKALGIKAEFDVVLENGVR